MSYTHKTESNTITVEVINNQLVVSAQKTFKRIEIQAEYIFDMLKDGLSIESIDPGIKRRALQLNGRSIHHALDLLK